MTDQTRPEIDFLQSQNKDKAFRKKAVKIANTLTKQEQEELFRLGQDIQAGLSCDANGTGLPCRTDRLDAVENMCRYLEIHGMKVLRDPVVWNEPSKSEEAEGKKRTKAWDGSNYPEKNPLGEDVDG